VSAYVSNNPLPVGELPALIGQVHTALKGTMGGLVAKPEDLKPAVPIRKSVTPDYIISLEDGKKFKSLKRHLATHYGLTPEEYRAKWGLSADYPMVAPNYAAARSALAKTMGLGRKPNEAQQAAPAKRSR
ncbi:MAG: MucR family transcriptional regulator, partial [Mesorhizobium sp.]